MRTHRLVPAVLATVLALAGCVSVQGGPPTPPVPGKSPAGSRPPAPASPTPPAPREELAGTDPVPVAATPRRTAAGRGAAPTGAPPRRLGPKDHRADPPGRARRTGAGEPERGGRGRKPSITVPRPAPRQTVRMRDLCQAARGTVDRSLADLCHRAYG
ncbi:hypothetical protein RND61_28035 [Streptomyces sp. TRM76323]|uniref:Lipoprotein n=1 Tax=Streptomyces tamarix TaxID=3078565 RepID=A0ABU3QTL4_9ACTN|nr:hypothetical protein [Streptomyces tamarix]MDT9685888.1 hypothetical protein [Streptomyces tamarix]